MKKISCIIVSILLAAVLLSSTTSRTIYGFQDNGIGEYVNVAPLKHGEWKTPPGHYGLMAMYANRFLSNAQANGNYLILWNTVKTSFSDYFVLDIRANSAYCLRHIIGAVNIPYATVAEPYNLELLPTEQPILVVCGSGLMSSQVAPLLGMMGYQVRILIGGMGGVPSADYPTYTKVGCP
jgi:rhodanese-related sulfurtransferase